MKENRLSLIGDCRKEKEGEVCKFLCSCGNTIDAVRNKVYRNAVRSCGCLRKEFLASGKARLRHGLASTRSSIRFWNIFNDIKRRTTKPYREDYHRYGGRGIKCEWNSVDEFKDDMYESYLEHVEKHGEKNTTIDRIDVDSNYSAENCRWATMKEQANNTRWNKKITYKGNTMTYTQWEEALGLTPGTVSRRIKAEWPIELVLSKEKYNGQHHLKRSKG